MLAMPAAVVRARRNVARHLAGRRSRRAYGGRFVTAVDPQDDLLHYAIANAGDVRLREYRGFDSYFNGGLENVGAIEDVLAETGPPLAQARSILEFACGYGRLTRHLVPRIERSRLTVSDIDADGVEFVTSTFGVKGFTSATDPADLVCEGRFELIVVVSLFSHLPEATWTSWLRTLLALLAPGGTLLFTTHRMRGHAVLPEDREGFARGFLYKAHNETRGRLDVEDYGTAVVSHDYLLAALDAAGATLIGHRKLAVGIQDAYVVRASAGG